MNRSKFLGLIVRVLYLRQFDNCDIKIWHKSSKLNKILYNQQMSTIAHYEPEKIELVFNIYASKNWNFLIYDKKKFTHLQ